MRIKTEMQNYSQAGKNQRLSSWRLFFRRQFKAFSLTASDGARQRRHLVLQTLTLSSVALLAVALLLEAHNSYIGNSANIGLLSFLLLGLLLIWKFNRLEYKKNKIDLFLLFYLLPALFFLEYWGAKLPNAILLYIMIVVATNLLSGCHATLFFAVPSVLLLFLTARFQNDGWIGPDLDWKKLIPPSDWFILFLSVGLIILICQIFNRTAKRFRPLSACAETAIAETPPFSETQLEKMSRLYRFAELGRLAGGLFHDLATPLTVINISLQEAKQKQKGQLNAIRDHLNSALAAAEKLNQFLATARSQLRPAQAAVEFRPAKEIENLTRLFAHKELQSGIKLRLSLHKKLKLHGDPIKFFQIASNLISNAFEAYAQPAPFGATVKVCLYRQKNRIVLEVRDEGEGISAANLAKIFEPFFTTKNSNDNYSLGLGLGLATTKNIVEKYFKGRIEIDSLPGRGTCFTVYLPLA